MEKVQAPQEKHDEVMRETNKVLATGIEQIEDLKEQTEAESLNPIKDKGRLRGFTKGIEADG
jgi:hypothetical protein